MESPNGFYIARLITSFIIQTGTLELNIWTHAYRSKLFTSSMRSLRNWFFSRSEPLSRQSSHEEPLQAHHQQRPGRPQPQPLTTSASPLHERLIRRGAMPHHHVPAPVDEQLPQQEAQDMGYRGRPRPRTQLYGNPPQQPEPERPRPRSFYEVPMAARELRGPRNVDSREVSVWVWG